MPDVDIFLKKITAASASKERVKNRLAIEMNSFGENEWTFSQSFTWLGTHEKALPNSVKADFTRFGSLILDTSLSDVLHKN